MIGTQENIPKAHHDLCVRSTEIIELPLSFLKHNYTRVPPGEREGDTLIFLYIRRLGSFFGGSKF